MYLLNWLSSFILQDFEKSNYDGANGFLAKIAANRSQDPKVIHNKAVVNYFKSGLRRTDEFKVHLLDVCNKVGLSDWHSWVEP